MMSIREQGLAAASFFLLAFTPAHGVESLSGAHTKRPDAIIDLSTAEGVKLIGGPWRYSDAKIVEIDSKGPGADLKPSGAPIRTYDVSPHAGVADFDDSTWQVLRLPKPSYWGHEMVNPQPPTTVYPVR